MARPTSPPDKAPCWKHCASPLTSAAALWMPVPCAGPMGWNCLPPGCMSWQTPRKWPETQKWLKLTTNPCRTMRLSAMHCWPSPACKKPLTRWKRNTPPCTPYRVRKHAPLWFFHLSTAACETGSGSGTVGFLPRPCLGGRFRAPLFLAGECGHRVTGIQIAPRQAT